MYIIEIITNDSCSLHSSRLFKHNSLNGGLKYDIIIYLLSFRVTGRQRAREYFAWNKDKAWKAQLANINTPPPLES